MIPNASESVEPRTALFRRFGLYLNPYVFLGSAGCVLVGLLLGALFPTEAGGVFLRVQGFLAATFGWFYTGVVGVLLFFVIYLFFSPFASIRLGPDDSRPDYSFVAWMAMLFSAGMGIGLIFYGVAEPVIHFARPPVGVGGTPEAARRSMQVVFFHWGLHAWAIYIVMGLGLAYFAHRRGLPLSIRSTLYPLIGERIYGRLGDLVDLFAVLGTLFGIATSLGLGVMQINAGLAHLGWLEVSSQNQIWLILAITLLATVSVASGLDRGILYLSNFNMVVATVLLLLVFLMGPTLFLLRSLIQNTGDYLQNLLALTFWNAAYRGLDWQKDWTLFYWAWWIAWSPFVGMFIARISRGRTIREFVVGVLLVPSVLGFVWLAVFGNTALSMELAGSTVLREATASAATLPTALYLMLARLPLSALTAVLATVVIATYFITSSDSGSLVIDIITAGGHTDPPLVQRIFWALMEGGAAAVLLVAGGLQALQAAALTTALPLAVVLLLIVWGLSRSLRSELAVRGSAPNDSGK